MSKKSSTEVFTVVAVISGSKRLRFGDEFYNLAPRDTLSVVTDNNGAQHFLRSDSEQMKAGFKVAIEHGWVLYINPDGENFPIGACIGKPIPFPS